MLTYSEITRNNPEGRYRRLFSCELYCFQAKRHQERCSSIKMSENEYMQIVKTGYYIICAKCYEAETGCKATQRFYIELKP